MLQRLTGRRFLLFLGAMLFALNGALHPLFHMETGGSGRAGETAFRSHDDHHVLLHPAMHCPVCSGAFSAAEIPETPAGMIPAAPAEHAAAAVRLRLPEFNTTRQARAPPRFS